MINTPQGLAEKLSLCAPGDAVLLIEDGVYALAELSQLAEQHGLKAYALSNDCEARAISSSEANLSMVSDEDWVALCTEFSKIISHP